MKATVICSLIVLPEILVNALVLADGRNSTCRSAYIVTKENKRLRGCVVQQVTSPNLMSCSHSCMRNARCTSTNFALFPENGVKGNCELIKHEISTINDDNFHDHYGVTFSLHLKVIIYHQLFFHNIRKLISQVFIHLGCISVAMTLLQASVLQFIFVLCFVFPTDRPLSERERTMEKRNI